jgi:hypothetical protein
MGTLPASFALRDVSRGASSSTHKYKCEVAVSRVKQHSRASVFPLRRRPAIQPLRVQSAARTQTILCTFASCADVCCTLDSSANMSGEDGSAASDVAGRPRRKRTLNVLHGDYLPTDLALAPVGRSANRAQAAAASAPGAASAEVAAPTSVAERQAPACRRSRRQEASSSRVRIHVCVHKLLSDCVMTTTKTTTKKSTSLDRLQILAQAASEQSQIDRAATDPSAAEDSVQVVSVPRPKRRLGCATSPQVRESIAHELWNEGIHSRFVLENHRNEVSRRYIYSILAQLCNSTFFETQPTRGGRAKKASDDVSARVITVVRKHPDLTLTERRHDYFQDLSISTLSRVIHTYPSTSCGNVLREHTRWCLRTSASRLLRGIRTVSFTCTWMRQGST